MNQVAEQIRLMRPHQRVKNAFVFVGLLFGHAWNDLEMVLKVSAAAVAFCLVSSAVYIVNDIADREHDRLHPQKKNRPLAKGTVSVTAAILLALALAVCGVSIAAWASVAVLGIIGMYAAMNAFYSLGLKNVAILDVFVIAAGFMLRLLAGTLGVGIAPSRWLLLCGFMLTLFLGFVKRRSEILALQDEKGTHRKALEEYTPVFLDKMISIAATSTILTYSLYTMSADTIQVQGTENLIFTVPFVIYGIFRYLYILHLKGGGADVTRDVVHDRHMIAVVVLWGSVIAWLIA